MDVAADPAALETLRVLGVPRVPAVVVGNRAAHGWDPTAYATLLDVRYTAAPRLAPAALASRLDRILAATEQLVRTIPLERMGWRPPERDRTVRDLAYHVFRLALAFVETLDLGRLRGEWLDETAPPELEDGAGIGAYGALVRARLDGWFAAAAAGEYARVVETYYGPQSGHELLERTAWHAGQHLRQFYVIVERLGLTPPAPLPVEAFEGLPLPEAIW